MTTMATVNYHIRSDVAQAFRFDVDGIAGNLHSPELLPTTVPVEDLRSTERILNFDRDGVAFLAHESAVQPSDADNSWQETYDRELEAMLREQVGAIQVTVFDHTVRIDDPNAARKPARNVHNDYSAAGAEQRLIDIVGAERAAAYRDGHYGFVNIWRPVSEIIRTSPLGFIRPDTVRTEDWMTIELIYPDRMGQILGLADSEDHEWFYLSEMTPSEVVIFNIYDNRGRPFLGHSALDMPLPAAKPPPRRSIESRTLVRYS